jgi:hypothetical protein
VPVVKVGVSAREVPVGLFAVTVAPTTGFPPSLTVAVKVAPGLGLDIATDKVWPNAELAIKTPPRPELNNSRNTE